MPLYMEAILNILRSLDSEHFSYAEFRRELEAQDFNKGQSMMLNLRLSLLDSCLKGGNNRNKVATHFQEGHLTIIEYYAFKICEGTFFDKPFLQPVVTFHGRFFSLRFL